MRKTAIAVLGILLFSVASVASAAEVPKVTWLRAKCAICHGEDGSGNTPEGKKRKVPDLRSEEIQKLSDEELTSLIKEGHLRMPAFKVQLNQEQIRAIVVYIRSLAKK